MERIIVSVVCLCAVLIIVFSDYGTEAKVYDCGMAEWHPDIPNEVRDACRKLRQENWNDYSRKTT